jgi:hypothetical protein
MTLCELITKPITRLVDEGKNLDEIAKEICPKVTYGREKIIRVIRDFMGEEYLVQHAEVLGYDVGKAQLAKKRKTTSHKKIDATTDTVIESNNAIPDACCQAVNTERRETGDTKGQEQALEEHDTSAVCCQERVVRKKIVSENRDLEEETTEKHDDAPELIVSNLLVEALKKLIKLFSIEDVKKALVVAESDI